MSFNRGRARAVNLRPVFADVMPNFDAIEDGELWISHKHRTINLRCPCGCGHFTILSLHPSRWHVCFDGKTISLDGPTGGSVWAHSGCGSHYMIRKSEVIWLEKIAPDRHQVYADAEQTRMLDSAASRGRVRTWLRRLSRDLPSRDQLRAGGWMSLISSIRVRSSNGDGSKSKCR